MFFMIIVVLVGLISLISSCCTLSCETTTEQNDSRNYGIAVLWISVVGFLIELILCLLFEVFTLKQAFFWVCYHPYHILIGIVCYFTIGVVYSFMWLPTFVRYRYARLETIRAAFEKNKTPESSLERHLSNSMFYGIRTNENVPMFFEYRLLVGRRIAWWWAYLINWILSDLLVNLVKWIGKLGSLIASMLRGIYDNIAKATIDKISVPHD